MALSTVCAIYRGDTIWGLLCTLNGYRRNKKRKQCTLFLRWLWNMSLIQAIRLQRERERESDTKEEFFFMIPLKPLVG